MSESISELQRMSAGIFNVSGERLKTDIQIEQLEALREIAEALKTLASTVGPVEPE